MKNLKKAGVLILCLTLTACNQKENTATKISGSTVESKIETTLVLDVASEVTKMTGDYSDQALNDAWSAKDSVSITLSQDGSNIDGEGAAIENNVVTITKPGTYVLSGTLTNGQVIVDLTEDENVHLVLNNASITCENQAPLVILSAKNTYLTLAKGTENTVTDGQKYQFAGEGDTEPDAAIFSKDDLIINGTGTLTVNANYNDGIKCKDDLQIIEGTLNITSVADGIVGKDSVSIRNGKFVINALKDGIKSSGDTDVEKGYIVIDGGDFTINAQNDGVQAVTRLIINDGTFDIVTGSGSAGVEFSNKDTFGGKGGGQRGGMKGERPEKPTGDRVLERPEGVNGGIEEQLTSDAEETESESRKGLKSDYNLGIFGGTFTIDSEDDAIHSNQSLLIEDGMFQIACGDDAVHSDVSLIINGGDMTITKSYEGMESRNIEINSGEIVLTSADDGVNSREKLTVNGGTISVDASGDALDTNGSIEMNGGMLLISGPTGNGNGILDYDSTFRLNGGVLLSAGTNAMFAAPSEESKQLTISASFEKQISGGTETTIFDDAENILYTFTPAKDYILVEISAPEIVSGKTYTITAGDETIRVKAGKQ